MPTVLGELSPVAYPPQKRWTREECERVEAAGIDLTDFELIEGAIISTTGKSWPHSLVAKYLWKDLTEFFGWEQAVLYCSIEVALSDKPLNLPQPDLILVKQPLTNYSSRFLEASDLDLIAEVSDTTLAFDLGVKAALYARAGIQEYWVADVNGRRLIVHRDPTPEGRWASVLACTESESVRPLAAPGRELSVSRIFAGLK